MHRTRSTVPAVVALAALAALLLAARPAPDGAARAAAEAIVAAHGGASWPVSRLAFTFTVTRDGSSTSWTHQWWPRQNRCVVSGPYLDGRPFTAEFDTQTLQGDFFVDNVSVEGDEVAKARDFAHHRHINDSYWLLMPIKLLDPGVRLELRSPDTLRLSFDAVGRTPSDIYDVVFDPATHRIVRWTYYPKGDLEKPAVFEWADYASFPPLTLPLKRLKDGKVFIAFSGVEVGG